MMIENCKTMGVCHHRHHFIPISWSHRILPPQPPVCIACSFGSSVAVSNDGQTIVVGAPANGGGTGAAYIYGWAEYDGGEWQQYSYGLVGKNGVDRAQGTSVSLSGDGRVAYVGGPGGDGPGVSYIFKLDASGSTWQQTSRLIGSGYKGVSHQGAAGTLSNDGKTLCVGAPYDDNKIGATWIFALDPKNEWKQVGKKLVGTGSSSAKQQARQGSSCTLDGQGLTMIEGGPYDGENDGAVWLFIKGSNGKWTQSGEKIVPNDGSVTSNFGSSVSLSYDGNTAVIGGSSDDNSNGAIWVFTRLGNVFSLAQPKFNGAAASNLGSSVAINYSGNLIVAGAPSYNLFVGAVVLFKLVNGVWEQDSDYMVGSDYVDSSSQGYSVTMDESGSIIVSSGPYDDANIASGGNYGAAWIFTQTR